MYLLAKFNVKLTRRLTLKLGAIATVAFTLGLPLAKFDVPIINAAEAGGSESKQMAFYHNQGICIGCRACIEACKTYYKWEIGAEWRKLPTKSTPDGNLYLSIACNHCANPACLKVCPVGAYTKRADGIVIQDPNKCVGCAYCTYACPYGAPQFVREESGAVHKCNFCSQSQDKGEKPLCVKTCPTTALRFGELKELQKEVGATTPSINGLPPTNITEPSFVIIPARHSDTMKNFISRSNKK
ncbi:4Fe-4S dicluster domain-containing protein [Desulfitobacterium sp. THU1]|uniref:4Fe-4S dicluster domain-containing protein n=1 Tax=Desulfitobacterium sp. THU1 TaxID=3138072 RepID=UPI0031204593